MNESLHIGVFLGYFSNGHWNMNIGIFELRFLLEVNSGADGVDHNVLISNNMTKFIKISKVL